MQGELFKAETGWFHVFRSLVNSDAFASMDGKTVKVYLVIKTQTNIDTGLAGPIEYETIAARAGISVSSVKRAIPQLESLGYVSRSPCGRSYVYRFQEKWRIHDESGKHTAMASWPYIPALVKSTADDLRAGRVPPNVHIERLQLNINHVGAGGVVINVQDALNQMHPNMRQKLISLLERAGAIDIGSYTQVSDDPDHG
ncbi:helix-turn-helix domain-containing protein [Paraburkholderia humisilvae]|uniref:Helix-turn-helix domain-containing protein n=1 Tax=Paraburkholderia humisilvae TaxID=627669 RepID=A0A6J5DGJ6_9BURK|nr:helix-turn-helix domain-containing protein [Paraburkholderia humisilvae]CAB3752574.1 hypothetical protein LMG29542_01817 [Paraburkholderia humisilvae]